LLMMENFLGFEGSRVLGESEMEKEWRSCWWWVVWWCAKSLGFGGCSVWRTCVYLPTYVL
jgi:hypothetical protein